LEYLGSSAPDNKLAVPGQVDPVGADLGVKITPGIFRVAGVTGNGRQ